MYKRMCKSNPSSIENEHSDKLNSFFRTTIGKLIVVIIFVILIITLTRRHSFYDSFDSGIAFAVVVELFAISSLLLFTHY